MDGLQGPIGTNLAVLDVNQVAHGFVVGDAVRLSGATYIKAQANTEANAEFVGIVQRVISADRFTVQTAGLITTLSGLTAGSVYYIDDDTAGLLTLTEPTDVGDVSKPVLIADTTTSGWIFNMRGFIVSAAGGGGSSDGWVDDSANAWTRTADTTFTVVGDRTAVFGKGTRLRVTDTTTKYFVVVASSHAAGTTTVTITGGTDYVLAADPTAQAYSYAANPQEYPDWFAYACAWTALTTDPVIGNGTINARFSVIAKRCRVEIVITMGSTTTYGSGDYRWSQPVAMGNYAAGAAIGLDTGTGFRTAIVHVDDGNNTIRVFTTDSLLSVEWKNTTPHTWASTDVMYLTFEYQI